MEGGEWISDRLLSPVHL